MTISIWKPEQNIRTGAEVGFAVDRPAIAALPNGGYVVGWREGNVLKFKVYDGLGNSNGVVTSVAASGAANQNYLSIKAIGNEGRFAVSWNESTGTDYDLKTRVFEADLTAGTVHKIADPTAETYISAMATRSNGGFVSISMDGTKLNFEIHDATGGSIRTVELASANGIVYPEITEVGADKFVVSYNEGGKTKVHVVDAQGAPTTVLHTAFPEAGDGTRSEVVGLRNASGALTGQFAIVKSNGLNITASVYNNFGEPVAGKQDILLTDKASNINDNMNVTLLRDGRIAVALAGEGAAGQSGGKIVLKILDTSKTTPSVETFVVDAAGTQEDPRVVELKDGRLSIVWRDPDQSPGVISNAIVDPRLTGVRVNGTEGADIYVGTNIADQVDTLSGAGGNDSLYGGAGDEFLNGGLGADYLDGGEGYNWASYTTATEGVTVNLEDTSQNRGEAIGDRYNNIHALEGSGFNDKLIGRTSGSTLNGNGGNDTLIGGAASDHFDGGADTDTVSYENAAAGVILDFFNNDFLGAAAGDSYNLLSIEAYVGSAFADVMVGFSSVNTFYGGKGGDLLRGRGGGDRLYGEDGDDTLEGGTEGDTLDGGAGFNYASYENAGGAVGAVIDGLGTVEGEAADDIYISIQGLIGSQFDDTLEGSGGANALFGGDGADTLKGGSDGSDTLDGGTGADVLQGGGGGGLDYASYANYKGTTALIVSLDPNDGDLLTGDAEGDTFASIEGLIGSNQNDRLIGSNAANHLLGGAGNDTLVGGAGNDTLDGAAGMNTAVFSGARSQYTIAREGANVRVTANGSDSDLLIGVRQLEFAGGVKEFVNDAPTGLSLSNAVINEIAPFRAEVGTLAATDADGDALTYSLAPGSSGSFVIDGNKLLAIGPLDFETKPVHALTIQASDGLGGVTSLNVNITVTNYTGETTPFTIRGTPRADVLSGEAGNDTIYGSGGNDVLTGEAGKDVFVFDTRPNKSSNVDRILDFRYQDDSIYLDNKYFTKLGSGSLSKPKKFKADMFTEGKKAKDAEDRIVYDKKTGALYYDQDGTGSKAQIKIATISNKTKMTYSDFFVV